MFKNKDIKFIFDDAEEGEVIFSAKSIEKDFDADRVREWSRYIQSLVNEMGDGNTTDNFDSIMRVVSLAILITCEVIQDDISWELPLVVKRGGEYHITRDLHTDDEILHSVEPDDDSEPN